MRYVVTPFIDELYPDEVVFLALHVSDAGAIPWGEARWDQYFPNPDYIPQVVVGCKADTYIGYPGYPPTQWMTRIDAQLAVPTDITMSLDTVRVAGDQWRFTTHVCMEPTGEARTVRTFLGYTIDGYPANALYTYRATVRDVAPYEDLALEPGQCLDVERDFTLQAVDLAHFETIVAVAWTQTPNAGFGEAYQATKSLLAALLGDGFESGDLSGWSAAQP